MTTSLDQAAQREAEVAELRASLAAARARADESDRKAREAHNDLLAARRRAEAVDLVREDLARARAELAETRHELTVERERRPEPDTPQIVEELRVAYAAKEAELRAELDSSQGEVVRLDATLTATEATLDGWANVLHDVAEMLGLPRSGPSDAVREAVGALKQRAEMAEEDAGALRELLAAADAQHDEVRRGDPDPSPAPVVRARSEAFGEIAALLGMRRNARPADVVAAVSGGRLGSRAACALDRLLVALWPGREDPDASPTPALESVDSAVAEIEEMREAAAEWANRGDASAAPAGFMARLFDVMLARVEAGDSDPELLDRLERIAKETPC